MFRVVVSALYVIVGVSAQLAGYGGYGGHYAGYGTHGLIDASGGGAYGAGAQRTLSHAASAYHGLGKGSVNQGIHNRIVAGAAVGGSGNSNAVQKHFNDHAGLQDNFNNGHNRVFSKEKVYSVDQAYGHGGKTAYGATNGNFGGYGHGNAYHSNDLINKNHVGGYGAYSGYGNGGYNNHLDQRALNHGYGHQAGQHHLNNYANHEAAAGQYGNHAGYSGVVPYAGFGPAVANLQLYRGGYYTPYHRY